MTATLIGATGLIGSYLLEELLNDNYFDTVRILIRRPLDIIHQKLEKKIVDFNDSDSLLVALSNSDVVFCTVGTTQKKVGGDKDAYRKIDYDIPVNAARFCKMTGCEKFILVSSIGADSRSRNFYLKLKGEIENAIKKTGLKTVHIIQPSILLGDRKEKRTGERIGQSVMSALSFLFPTRFKPIHAMDVAYAMKTISKDTKEGFFISTYKEIKQIANKS